MCVVGVDKTSVGNATGLLAAAAAVLGQRGTYVRLHPDSIEALKVGKLVPGTDGFYRMMVRGTASGSNATSSEDTASPVTSCRISPMASM